MIDSASWTLSQSILAFLACTLSIGVFGTWITGVVDQLADRTGIGEALAGAVLLGVSTSLGGSVLSVVAAWNNNADLALGNALGGIAVQFAALAIADFAYRRANLEHAAASAENLMQSGLLIALLALILIAPNLPDITLWGVHPITPIMLGFYGYGLRMIRAAHDQPMWLPKRTRETREDKPGDLDEVPALAPLAIRFLILMLLLGITGYAMEHAASNIAQATWFSFSAVGVLFTATATSLPELVTSIAAVRRGALTLAVGGIIGGNAFDTLFTAASDVAYRRGSIYHAMPASVVFWTALTLLMAAILLLGLIRRQKEGPAGVGAESLAVLLLYAVGIALLLGMGDV